MRSKQRAEREDAGTSMSDEQMRSGPLQYPVDRYLVESSKMFEMVNIIDDEIWNPEPALRPEDEIILRKLHEMLQSTAEDLKLLSGELSKFHESGVQVKTAPTPLDDEFNEKVHIEEIVNAKFHGYKIIDTRHRLDVKPRINCVGMQTVKNTQPKINNTVAQNNTTLNKRQVINRNLGISRTRIVTINEDEQDSSNKEKLNNGRVVDKAPSISYNEFRYKHTEPEVQKSPQNKLHIQDMPPINIRSELKEQKVLQLDILPDSDEVKDTNIAKSNVSVVAVRYEKDPLENVSVKIREPMQYNSNKNIRKISKMSTCDSSGSANYISSDAKVKLNTQKRIMTSIRNSPKSSARGRNKKNTANKTESGKRPGLNLDEWKKKLNIVYGSSGSKTKVSPKSSFRKAVQKKSSPKPGKVPKILNTTEYIPYSQLTLGGVRVSDIEKEISELPNKQDIPLSPILDKILTSREHSFHKESPRKPRLKNSPKILTTSDENLLHEVMDIEKSISETLSKNFKKTANAPALKSTISSSESTNDKENESYADDFEDDKSNRSGQSGNPLQSDDNALYHNASEKLNLSDIDDVSDVNSDAGPGPSKPKKNTTYTKSSRLSFKDSVDIFEFIHSVDMQDIATQSHAQSKISPKETQTSPRNNRQSIQPIHNDLWPSIDPHREVEKMFEIEKDFIKKLILEEYGDLLEKNICKPSTSNENNQEYRKNVATSQMITQTSPAHVKSVMTSPKLTKTRTTSPFTLSVPNHQQTSPCPVSIHQQNSPITSFTNDQEQRIDSTIEADDISVNLSSPRFSLRLPQTSREVLSNLRPRSRTPFKPNTTKLNNLTFRKTTVSTSSSVDADNSSSELSSLGELKIKRLRKRVPTVSECSLSSAVSKYSSDFQSYGLLPLRSEGEVSLGQVAKIRKEKSRQSDGETSLDPFK